jgi:hypothetical protein
MNTTKRIKNTISSVVTTTTNNISTIYSSITSYIHGIYVAISSIFYDYDSNDYEMVAQKLSEKYDTNIPEKDIIDASVKFNNIPPNELPWTDQYELYTFFRSRLNERIFNVLKSKLYSHNQRRNKSRKRK